MADPLTEKNRRYQLRLAASTVGALLRLWPLFDPDDFSPSLAAWVENALRIVEAGHAKSAAAGRAYYRNLRLSTVGFSAVGVLPTPALDLAAARTSLIVTGPAAYSRAVARGAAPEVASRSAAVASARAGSRQALTGGRNTVLQSLSRDPRAKGWVRVTGGDPCDFCVLQTGRGAVYSVGTVDFAAHANCACQPEPAFE